MTKTFVPFTAHSVHLLALTVKTMLYSIWEDKSWARSKPVVTQIWMSASDRGKENSSKHVHEINNSTICVVCHCSWWMVWKKRICGNTYSPYMMIHLGHTAHLKTIFTCYYTVHQCGIVETLGNIWKVEIKAFICTNSDSCSEVV